MGKVYVSSTVADLKDERQAVLDWLRTARHQAIDSYLPDSESVRESCLADIDTCDLFVLILGHRYGLQPEDGNPDKLSITHLEYRRARDRPIPVVALMRTSLPNVALSDMGDPARLSLVMAFRAEVQRDVRPAEFADEAGLLQGLSTGIQNEFAKLQSPSLSLKAASWLAAHAQDLAERFTKGVANPTPKPGVRAADLYIDLVVAERQIGDEDGDSGTTTGPIEGRPLREVLSTTQTPLILLGEGGAGKTTSLLYAAAQLAAHARSDPAAPVPLFVNLARLTHLKDVGDLQQFVADSTPIVSDWNELTAMARADRRRLLFLFDSFNEIPEQMQRTAAVILTRFVDKQHPDHGCLIGSRLVSHIEQLATPPSRFATFEVLRLTPEQVQGFLEDHGLKALYERMSRELRDLAANPFMLLAIARSLAGKPESALPKNRGKLYEMFAKAWMAREAAKPQDQRYLYDRVKEPLLAYLAKRMTAAGQVRLSRTGLVEDDIERQLDATYQRVKRRGGMPEAWTVDECLAEITRDGLFKRTNDQLYFLHQSVQEYFTAVFFRDNAREALIEFMPKLVWSSVPTYRPVDVPNHRFVSALLLMIGLVDDGTAIAAAVAERNPVIGAAAIAAANKIDPALIARLEDQWLAWLDEDVAHQVVGCSALVHASMRSRRAINRLIDFSRNSYVGKKALAMFSAPDAIVSAVVARVRELPPDDGLRSPMRDLCSVIRKIESPLVVDLLFEEWRAAAPDVEIRRRIGALLASVDESMLLAELERLRANADHGVATDAEQAWAERESWKRVPLVGGGLLEAIEKGRAQFTARVADATAALRIADDAALVAGIRSPDAAVRTAAAAVAAERQAPVADVICEVIPRFGAGGLTDSLVALCGESTAVAKMLEQSHRTKEALGTLDPDLVAQLRESRIPSALKAAIVKLGAPDNLDTDGQTIEGTSSIWFLTTSSWGGYRPSYELHTSEASATLYDCNVHLRAFEALAAIRGDAALVPLRQAMDAPDPRLQKLVITALAERDGATLAPMLLDRLKTTEFPAFVDVALESLAKLDVSTEAAIGLLGDLLRLTESGLAEYHPQWGEGGGRPGWSDYIHRIFVRAGADQDIQLMLDRTLVSGESAPKTAALREMARWFKEDVAAERLESWRTSERLQQITRIALADPDESVRTTAATVLQGIDDVAVRRALAEALFDTSSDVRFRAAEAAVLLKAEGMYNPVSDLMVEVTKGSGPLSDRQRAGKILSSIPRGTDRILQPIQSMLNREEDLDEALVLIDAALEFLPTDVDLHWFRGYALRQRGRLREAADSYERAGELAEGISIIPLALGETLIRLEEYGRALAAAQQAAQLAPDVADAYALIAWASYKTGDFAQAARSAQQAVDLDPVHSDAIWIAALAHVKLGDIQHLRESVQHAMKVRELLTPGIDTTIEADVLAELSNLQGQNAEVSAIVKDVVSTLGKEPQ